MRGLLGIGQAGAYATTASLLRRWIPLARRGVANSAVSLGGRAGGVLAPVLTAKLMAARRVFRLAGRSLAARVHCIYALVGIVWAVVFLVLVSRRPARTSRRATRPKSR